MRGQVGSGGSLGEGLLIGKASTGFVRQGEALTCDGVSLDLIAESVGTPVYVYSAASIDSQYRRLSAALAGIPHRLHYSVKANSNLAILGLLRRLGSGVDVVSGG